MSEPLVLHIHARADLIDAALWSENARPGWSKEFDTCVDETLSAIAERPKSFPIVRKDVRRALVRRFPYAAYFRETNDGIIVLAVLHIARSPSTWQDRA